VTPVLFPKQGYDAWCANSMLRSKKNATLILKKSEVVWYGCCKYAAGILVARVNIITILIAVTAFQRSNNSRDQAVQR
jgi:hypothetical protein